MRVKRFVLLLCALLMFGVAACGDDDDGGGGESVLTEQKGSPAQGKGPVKIAFSTPAADHGWLKAISDNAKQAGNDLGEEVDLTVNDSAASSAEQADQIETLIQRKPDVLVILPFEGDALTPVAQKATDAGIPVVNVDREFSTPGAYRTWIGGDNYGIGYQAGNYFADQLKCKGNVVEIQGIAGISVTELRTKGFNDAIEQRCKGGIKVVARQPADFLPDKGLTVMENILEAQDKIDGVYTHDDDGRGRRGGDRERQPPGRDVPYRRRRLQGGDGSHHRRRPLSRHVPLQPGDVRFGDPAGQPDRARRGHL